MGLSLSVFSSLESKKSAVVLADLYIAASQSGKFVLLFASESTVGSLNGGLEAWLSVDDSPNVASVVSKKDQNKRRNKK